MDTAERIRTRGLPLVCAVDQRPFISKRNRFSILVPMLGPDGTVFQTPEEEFPNRGRIWWMLHDGIDDQAVVPGTLWTVLLEQAIDRDPDDPDKDHFQVRMRDVAPGARHCYEILKIDADVDPDRLLAEGLALDRPVNQRVLVRGPRHLTGPFEAAWNRKDRLIELKAAASSPVIYRLDHSSLQNGVIHDFTFVANRWDPRFPHVRISISLVHEDDIEELLKKGEHLDGMDDSQLLNWGLKRAQLTNKERQVVKEAVQAARNLPSAAGLDAHRVVRFKELLGSRDRMLALGEDVALAIHESLAMKQFTEKHLQSLLADRLKAEVASRSTQIEEELAGLQRRRERLEKDLQGLEREYGERKHAQDVQLEKEHAAVFRECPP